MNYIGRPYYVRQLGRWRDRDVIKVITGVRRCGKSTVLEMFRDEATRNREFAPLIAIHDHHPKTLITLDEDLPSSLDGIRQVNAYDFLLNATN